MRRAEYAEPGEQQDGKDYQCHCCPDDPSLYATLHGWIIAPSWQAATTPAHGEKALTA
jgi:hypothetical protein